VASSNKEKPEVDDTFSALQNPLQRGMLRALATCGSVTHAAKAAKINKSTHYLWLKEDEQYAQLAAIARELAGDALEDEAVRRAQLGVRRNIYHAGKKIGYETEYSDTLLIFLLKGAKPQKYGTKTVGLELPGPAAEGPQDTHITISFVTPK